MVFLDHQRYGEPEWWQKQERGRGVVIERLRVSRKLQAG
jgi:hypothetical protein